MTDIELIIRIPNEVYKKLKDPSTEIGYYATEVCNCVIKGKPLPKTGHWIERTLQSYDFNGNRKILVCSVCKLGIANGVLGFANFCPNCGTKMIESQEGKED